LTSLLLVDMVRNLKESRLMEIRRLIIINSSSSLLKTGVEAA
jgi:hypothetical protein